MKNCLQIDLSGQAAPVQGAVMIRLISLYEAECSPANGLSEEERLLICHYLPYCLLSLQAHTLGRTVAVAHYAQSLDGRIATAEGHSRGIGSAKNLEHAHRMRALCDSILIGQGTLDTDQPSLTCRIVEGDNPLRIVISADPVDCSSLIHSSTEEILLVNPDDEKTDSFVNRVKLPFVGGRLDCEELLKYLYAKGLYTVYIEGGSFTTSCFLGDGMIDLIQLHISPLVFGSGKAGFALPEISTVAEAVRFKRHGYRAVGDAVMFTGEL